MNDKLATITSKQKNMTSRSGGSASGKNKPVASTKSSSQHLQKHKKKTINNGTKKTDTQSNASKQDKGKQKKRKATPQQNNKRTLSTKRSNHQ
eukprot:1079963-Ditylum_brightwellii.AAC.1